MHDQNIYKIWISSYLCYAIFDKAGLSGDHNKTTVIGSLLFRH